MKTLNKLFVTGAMAFLLMLMAPHKSMAQDGYVSDQEFYDNLQQYGTWVQDDQYGDVWVPDVDDDFRPYATNGYWVQTDYGTTWVSDYPWGWATFHYGRWRYDDYYGWEWIPGHEWAPAWVSWRQGGGYYGWAPMGPGISVTLSLGGGGYTNNSYWTYAPQRYITSRYIGRYYAPRTQVNIIVRNTTYIRNTYVYENRTYITGPRPADIQRITRRRVNVYKINDAPRPGGIRVGVNVINIYRPAIRKTQDARPTRVVSGNAYKNDHPNEGIGRRGGIGYNKGNAGKLASAARTDNPDGRVVRVNPKSNGNDKPNNQPANNPTIPAGGHNRNNEPKTNPAGQPNIPQQGDRKNHQNEPTGQPNTPQQGGDRKNHQNEPANQPQQNGGQQPQTGGNEPVRPGQGHGQHKTVPTAGQPQQGAEQPQQQPSQQPAQQQGNPTAQPGQTGRHQRGHNPAVNPPAQNNTDQAQKQQKQEAQQAAQRQKQQSQQAAQQQREQAQQQQKEQQQQAQQQRQQAQQQQKEQQVQQQARQQQQQAQQQARQQAQQQQKEQQAQQQQRQQQQQAQQQARQQAQQQKQAQQQAQKQQRQQQEAQQRKQQEEQQKQKENPPRI